MKKDKKTKFLYAPKIANLWEDIKVNQLPLRPMKPMGNYWMPLFESKKECKRFYPKTGIIKLKVI